MKATNFRVGDFVWWRGDSIYTEPAQIDCVTKTSASVDGDYYDDFDPIFLTKEIMEKNGYESEIDDDAPSPIYKLKNNIYIDFSDYSVCAAYKNDYGVLEYIDFCTCKFVHQLQHLLSDLEIEKEIIA